MKWSEYVAKLMRARDMNQVDAAEESGVSQSTISRWLKDKGQPDAGDAAEFARALKGNPVEALVILGVIRPRELDQVVEIGASAGDLTNGQLVELVARRLGVAVVEARGVSAG